MCAKRCFEVQLKVSALAASFCPDALRKHPSRDSTLLGKRCSSPWAASPGRSPAGGRSGAAELDRGQVVSGTNAELAGVLADATKPQKVAAWEPSHFSA